MSTRDEILNDIVARLEANGSVVNQDDVRTIASQAVQELLADDDFQRKFRTNTEGDKRLVGSKFARWNLGPADIEFMYDLQRGAAAGDATGRTKGPSDELTQAFEAISEANYIPQERIREIDKKAIDDLYPRVPKGAGTWQEFLDHSRAIRAMDTAETGYGSQLIGAQYVGELWEGARQQSRVFNLLNTFEMTDPTAYLPVEADIPEMLFVSESTASNSSNYTTSKSGSNRVTVSASKFVIHQMWSGEMQEDSIIAFVPFLRAQAVKSIAHYSDSLVLNGDTTNAGTGNINLDDADPADTKHYLAFDGIRHAAIVDNTGNAVDTAGALTKADVADIRSKMLDTTNLMDWGHPTNSDDLVYVADPTTADKVAALDEVVNWNIAQGRPLLTGQVGQVLGHPVISSMAMSLTEADGKVSTTGGNNTLGQIAVFNTGAFVPGWRRRVRVEVERIPATDQTRIVYSLRLGFGRFSSSGAASGIEAAAVLYNITV